MRYTLAALKHWTRESLYMKTILDYPKTEN